MADTFDKTKRSWIMARVLSSGTKPEQKVREVLRSAGLRFSEQPAGIPGNPDFAFRKLKLAVFVNGCFWHWHGCPRCRMPASNAAYWQRKIDRNMVRDREHRKLLHRQGWRYVTIWECDLKGGLRRCLRTVVGCKGAS